MPVFSRVFHEFSKEFVTFLIKKRGRGRGAVLILVQKGKCDGGFFLKRRAKRGKLPPVVQGISVGGHPCALLGVYGKVTQNNRFLAPYFARGDVVIGAKEVAEQFAANRRVEGELLARLTLNGVKEWCKEKGRSPIVVDPLGVCMGVVAELCKLGLSVWVVTPTVAPYLPCLEYTTLTMGNPFMITATMPGKGDLVFAPYGLQDHIPPKGAVVFAPHTGRWVTKKTAQIPRTIVDSTPPGFDPLTVMAGCMAAFGGKYLE